MCSPPLQTQPMNGPMKTAAFFFFNSFLCLFWRLIDFYGIKTVTFFFLSFFFILSHGDVLVDFVSAIEVRPRWTLAVLFISFFLCLYRVLRTRLPGFSFFFFSFFRLRCRSEENRRKESEILFFFFFFFFWTHNPQRITNKQTNKQTNKNIELRWNGHRRRNAVAFHARPAISMSATRRRQNHPISSFFFCFFLLFLFFFLWGFQNNWLSLLPVEEFLLRTNRSKKKQKKTKNKRRARSSVAILRCGWSVVLVGVEIEFFRHFDDVLTGFFFILFVLLFLFFFFFQNCQPEFPSCRFVLFPRKIQGGSNRIFSTKWWHEQWRIKLSN